MKKSHYILFLLLFSGIPLYAQLQTNHWYFGQKAGLDFTTGQAVADNRGIVNTKEGSAAISDECGNVLFYTDGSKVYTRSHNAIMPNGFPLFGDKSTSQSAIVIPKPNDSNIYYIFTADDVDDYLASKGINYSIVDMSQNTGSGVVTQRNIPLPLSGFQKSSEKLTAVANADGTGYWVVTHFSNSYYAFAVTALGVNPTPVISRIGRTINMTDFTATDVGVGGRGYLKISPDGTKIAAAHLLRENISGALALYDFNSATGVVSNEKIDLFGSKVFYSVEFSPDSKALYATYNSISLDPVTGYQNNSYVVQYDTTSSDIANSEYILSSIPILGSGLFGYYALQMGLDYKIYIARDSNAYLPAIENPNQIYRPITGQAPTFVDQAVFVGTNSGGGKLNLGLPNFVTSFFNGGIYFKGDIFINGANADGKKYCLGNELTFSPDMCGLVIQTHAWDFGDGNTSAAANPVHTYQNTGTYTITLKLTAAGGQSNTFTSNIEIVPLPTAASAVLEICLPAAATHTFDLTAAYPQINPNNEIQTITFHTTKNLAETGETTPLLSYSTATNTILWIRIENANGCFVVKELALNIVTAPVVTAFAPATVCVGTKSTLIAAATSGTIHWYDSATATTPIFSGTNFETPNLSAAVSYWAEASIVSANNLECKSTRIEIIATVIAQPTVTTTTQIAVCTGDNLTLTASSAGNTIYWFNTIDGTVAAATGNYSLTNLTATTSYWTEALDAATGCKSQRIKVTVTVNPIPAITRPSPLLVCDNGSSPNSGLFNLQSKNDEITNHNSSWNVSYYLSPLLAQQGSAVNVLPLSYPSTAANQTVYVRVVSTTGCVAFTELELKVMKNVLSNVPLPIAICDNDNTNDGIATFDLSTLTAEILDDQNPSDYTITYHLLPNEAQNGTNPIQNPETHRNTSSPYLQTLYIRSVRTDAAYCFATATVKIIVQPPLVKPEITTANGNNTICVNYQTAAMESTLLLQSSLRNPNYNYVWYLNGTVIPLATSDFYEVDSPAPGLYTVLVTDTQSTSLCNSALSAAFEVIQSGSATITATTTTNPFENNQVITISTAGYGDYWFQLDHGSVLDNNGVFSNVASGIHTVVVHDRKTGTPSCSPVTIENIQIINFPVFFTPNNDGYNDSWNIPFLSDQPKSQIVILDRYGKILKTIKPSSSMGWDGNYNGKMLPADDYWFVLTYFDKNGVQREFKSHFSLKR